MKTKRLRRIYHFSDAELLGTTAQKIAFMQRDASHFAGYGITQTDLGALLSKTAFFSNLPTLAELRGTEKEVSQIKKEKRLELIEALENIKRISALKFKKGSAVYKAFHRGNLILEKDADLFITAKVITVLAIRYLPELSLHGLTMERINQIGTLNDEFTELALSRQLAKQNISEHTNECILLGNEIHSELIRFTTLGMALWNTKSKARYNDYVIYTAKNKSKAS